jgi:hypothetical protein
MLSGVTAEELFQASREELKNRMATALSYQAAGSNTTKRSSLV